MGTREGKEHMKNTVKGIKKMKTKEYVDLAKEGHSGAKKVLSMAKKPHKAKKAYLLSTKKLAK
jgi:hypothetical protein